jgi:hypothetical protein
VATIGHHDDTAQLAIGWLHGKPALLCQDWRQAQALERITRRCRERRV